MGKKGASYLSAYFLFGRFITVSIIWIGVNDRLYIPIVNQSAVKITALFIVAEGVFRKSAVWQAKNRRTREPRLKITNLAQRFF